NELYDIFSDTYVWSVDKITDKTAVSEESLHQTKLKKEGEIAYLPGRSIEITDADIAELEFVFDAGLDGNIITGYTGKNKNIRFPAEIDGVKTVGVKLPKTNNLNNIEMPDGVVTIDFENCPNLETVKLSTGLTTIPKSAFYECESLTSIDIPNGVTSIEDGAFSRCKALASVTLPNTLTTIGAGAFSSCGLEQLTIPSSVTEIGSGAFNYCESLKTVNFPDTPIAFGYNAFSNCIALEEITLPGGIGDGSGGEIFAYCNNLKKVTVYRTLSNAKYDATDYRCEDGRVFYLCPSLEEVVLISTPDSEFIIPSCAFEECSALKIIDTSKCDNLVLCDAILADCPSIQTISLPDNTRPIVNNINRVTPFYKANESLVVTYKGKEYNYTNFNEMFK
ncbi:MAG: leucine-rich repeat domain-containing protein, partial [Oscillospiraceae bacterium]|nr:leucine-rich repeat domain-containing protein [Oscillospiraceae bacterium]